MLSLPDYRVGNFLEENDGTKKIILGVFSGVTTSGPSEYTGFNTHYKFSVSKVVFPVQSQRLQVFVVIMDSLPEDLECPTKAVCAHFVPLPPLEGYTVQGNPQTLRREEPEQHYSNTSVTVS